MERKESARKNILMIAAMSGGEILGDVAKEICGTERYYQLIMHNFKKNEEAEIIFGNKPRTVLIKNNGIEVVYDDMPYALELNEAKAFVYRKGRSERKASISQTIYNAQLADLNVYPNEKDELYKNGKIDLSRKEYSYYTPIEVKSENGKELRGSRLSGLLIGNGRLICLYNAMDKNIKYRTTVEMNAHIYLSDKTRNKTRVEKIFFCKDFYLVNRTILNNKVKENLEKQGKTTDFITSDIGGYIVPNGKKGSLYLKLILCPQIVNDFKQIATKVERREVVNCLTLTLQTCRRIAAEKGEVTLLCTNEQKEMLEGLNNNPKINYYLLDECLLNWAIDDHIAIHGFL